MPRPVKITPRLRAAAPSLPSGMPRRKFSNPWPHEIHGLRDIFRWKFGIGPQETPLIPDAADEPAGCVPLDPGQIASGPSTGWRITWLGHASFLIQSQDLSLLIDPVFSEYCAPLPLKGLRRRAPLPCALEDLPDLDVILLTHGHYDHLDLPTLRRLRGTPRILIAEGHAKWLERKIGRPAEEIAWRQTVSLADGTLVTATPAQHFTARTPLDRDRGHWCGWLIEGRGTKLWHAGDSGYCPAFQEIGTRHGPIDFAMIPIGAYQPRSIMKPMHMNPEEAVQAFEDAGCLRAAAMHWGTFTLTDEPMGEPPLRLQRELERRNLPAEAFTARPIGSQWMVGG